MSLILSPKILAGQPRGGTGSARGPAAKGFILAADPVCPILSIFSEAYW